MLILEPLRHQIQKIFLKELKGYENPFPFFDSFSQQVIHNCNAQVGNAKWQPSSVRETLLGEADYLSIYHTPNLHSCNHATPGLHDFPKARSMREEVVTGPVAAKWPLNGPLAECSLPFLCKFVPPLVVGPGTASPGYHPCPMTFGSTWNRPFPPQQSVHNGATS